MRLFVVVSFRALFDSVYSLRVELIVDKINYSPDTRDAYDSVKYTRADVCFRRKYPVYKVKIEGLNLDRFITNCVKNGIILKNVPNVIKISF